MKLEKFVVSLFLLAASLPLKGADYPCVAPPDMVPPHTSFEKLYNLALLDEVLLLMQKKLAVSHELARWMWNEGIEVENPERETRMLQFLLKTARENGIPAAWASPYAHAQIEAAKLILLNDYRIWRESGQGDFEEVCDYDTELHPFFVEISEEIFEKLGALYPYLETNFPPNEMLHQPLSPRECDAIFQHAWQRAIRPFYCRVVPK